MERAAIDKALRPGAGGAGVGAALARGRRASRRASPPAGRRSRRPFVVLLPPPNVTGVLHMGHVLANTLQDVFVRYHAHARSRDGVVAGHRSRRHRDPEGRREEPAHRKASIPRRSGARRSSSAAGNGSSARTRHIVAQMQRIGWSLDWSREYFTLDAAHEPRGAGSLHPTVPTRVSIYKRQLHHQLVPDLPHRDQRRGGRARRRQQRHDLDGALPARRRPAAT